MMNLGPPDFIGFVGVGLIIATYFLSQIGRMDIQKPFYPAVNGVGALMILVSLAYNFNPASFVIEIFWLAISAIGLARALMRGRSS